MKSAYILPILLTLTTGISTNEDSNETSIFELATKSQFFIDKTELLKVFLQHERSYESNKYARDKETRAMAFTCPNGFGKSTNLDMIRRFFEIPFNTTTGEKIDKKTTQYYKLFSKLMITKDEDFIKQHFGEYPVIHLDLGDIQGETTDEIITSMRKQIGHVINSYRWLCIKTRKENENSTDQRLVQHMNLFKKIFKKTATADDFVSGLEGLAELLIQHFDKKRILVLIDNYDTPITFAISNSINAKPIYDYINSLIKKFVNYDQVPCNVMIVGVGHSFFEGGWDFSSVDRHWIDAIQRNVFLRCPFKFGKYFGFTDKEMDRLLTKGNINKEQYIKIKKHFNHYKFMAPDDTCIQNLSLYHPKAVLQYLETNIIEDHHLSTDTLVPQIMKCLRHEKLFTRVWKFLTKQVQLSWFYYPLSSRSYFHLFVNLVRDNCSERPLEYIFDTVLFNNGYLSFAKRGIEISNKMAENQLKRNLNKFFFDSHNINITNSYITTSIQSILDTPISTEQMLTNLTDSLQRMINSLRTRPLNKFQFLSLMFGILINYGDSVPKKLFSLEQIVPFHLVDQCIDRLMIRNRDQKIAMIVRISYNETLQEVIDDATNYVPRGWGPYNDDFKVVKYLGINLNQMNQVEVGKSENIRQI